MKGIILGLIFGRIFGMWSGGPDVDIDWVIK